MSWSKVSDSLYDEDSELKTQHVGTSVSSGFVKPPDTPVFSSIQQDLAEYHYELGSELSGLGVCIRLLFVRVLWGNLI